MSVGASVLPAEAPFAVMTRPVRYALRMAAFLVVIAIVVVVLRGPAVQFFLRNPPLNALILSVLAVGIVLSFRAVLSLDPEVTWIERCQRGDARLHLQPVPPLLGPLATLLADPVRRMSLTTSSVRGMLDGVDGRLDERRDTSRYLIALLIFLGLLGTFWGLLLTASSVGETIRGLHVTGADPAQMFETLRAGLEAPLSGMGTAFSTSLFGLASSLVLGFLDLQASQAQGRFANELETWLTGFAQGEGRVVADAAAGPGAPSYVTALLQQTAENLADLERRMVRVSDDSAGLREALRVLGDRLTSLTDELRAKTRFGESANDGQLETMAVLRRIAHAVERQGDGPDEAARAIAKMVEDGARERDRAVAEIRNEIRLLARTLSVIADRER